MSNLSRCDVHVVRNMFTFLCLQVEDIQKGNLALGEYGLEEAATKLDPANEVI